MNLARFPVFSVSQVNHYLKDLMEKDGLLTGLLVRGEISNYKLYPSGHHYFSLKDAQGSIRCVMFRGDALRLRFRPVDGMRIVAFGRVSVFPRDGQYQLYCSELIHDGQGELDLAFEQLRSKLEAEGLFAPENKQKLPAFPKRLALVTSPAGAAVRDMIRILGVRWPLTQILVVPVRVQGEGAAEEIAEAIHAINNRNDIDVMIVGRGGGSKEDLWAFNEEVVARAIYISNIPVISAVGHEPDVSISDYVADVRASTPSNGAELAVPDQEEQRARLDHLLRRLTTVQQNMLTRARKDLEHFAQNRVLRDGMAPINDRRLHLDSVQRAMAEAVLSRIKTGRMTLVGFAAALEALSPLKVLGRGYAIAKQGSNVVGSVLQAEPLDELDVLLSDGVLHCQVTGKENRTWQ